MEVLEILKVVGSAIGGGGLMLFFVKAKNRWINAGSDKQDAETAKIKLETELLDDESSLTILGQSFNDLVKIYDAKFKAQSDLFDIKFETVTFQYNQIKLEMDTMKAHFEEKEKGFIEREIVYKLDIELLQIHKLCAEEMKKCPDFKTCPGAILYHKLLNK